MAWVEQHGNLFHVAFRIGDRRFKKTLKSTDRRAADALAQRIDERLRLIDQGHITIPEGVDLVASLFSVHPTHLGDGLRRFSHGHVYVVWCRVKSLSFRCSSWR